MQNMRKKEQDIIKTDYNKPGVYTLEAPPVVKLSKTALLLYNIFIVFRQYYRNI